MRPSRYQLKIALSYIAILIMMLIVLNTYPVIVSQDFVFNYKKASMKTQATLMAVTLSDLDTLAPESIERVMSVLDDGSYRVVVCDHTGLCVYDSNPTESVTGRYTLLREIVAALSGQDVYSGKFSSRTFESRYAMPVTSRGQIIGALYLGEFDSAQAAIIQGLINNLGTMSAIVFAAVVVFSLFISIALTRRLGEILKAIRAAGEGSYEYHIELSGRDELTEVAGGLNELSTKLKKTEALRQQFVSNASHELKTPLASVRLLADSILQTPGMPLETMLDFVEDISAETERLSRMTEKLMHLSRLESETTRLVKVNPKPCILRAARMLSPLAEKAGMAINCELGDGCEILGTEDDLYQIVFNLIDNAIKYNHPDGVVQVLLFRRDLEVHIIVSDTGVGIPEGDLALIFGRFYRVDKARSREAGGSGLGLAIVADTVERMGGTVSVDSIFGKGTRFTVLFPAEGGERDD